jgi:hypothetical protein
LPEKLVASVENLTSQDFVSLYICWRVETHAHEHRYFQFFSDAGARPRVEGIAA